MKTIEVDCVGYAVVADLYDSKSQGPILLCLIGSESRRDRPYNRVFLSSLAENLNITSLIFDYSGHGDSPFNNDELCQAQHFLEVVTVFDWLKDKYPKRQIFVMGSSYGGFLATQLTKYRRFDDLVLRAPAIYRPQDFYTRHKDRSDAETQRFRRDTAALAVHPLLARAAKFAGDTLLLVHNQDERIPKETTDAYAKAFGAEVVYFDMTHNLSDATPAQLEQYNNAATTWLAARVSQVGDVQEPRVK